jgi:putative tryptophan/tyrosine transport system substrate-binding protein
MKRREFIRLLGGAAAAWPLAARAQQATMPVIGFLHAGSPDVFMPLVAEFRQALSEAGFVEGRNVVIEYRWAEGRYDRMAGMVADLISRQVAVLVTAGSDVAALAAKAATSTVPTLVTTGSDPVELGLVASLSHPGGNITGVNLLIREIGAKRLGLLREFIPTASIIGVLLNPQDPLRTDAREIAAAASKLGQTIVYFDIAADRDIEPAFAAIAQQGVGAILVLPDSFITTRRDQVIALAARYAIPAMYYLRSFAVSGGLMSYGISLADAYRQLGNYAGRILKGTAPADLPMVQTVKFELVINLKAAKALGLEVPDRLLALADEVIE